MGSSIGLNFFVIAGTIDDEFAELGRDFFCADRLSKFDELDERVTALSIRTLVVDFETHSATFLNLISSDITCHN